MKKYGILFMMVVGFVMAFMPLKTWAQGSNRNFLEGRIDCSSPFGGTNHSENMGSIADPTSINIPIQDIPMNFNCDSRQFYEKQPGQFHSYGAACLTINVSASGAMARELSLTTDPTAPKLKFNFTYQGSADPSLAVGNAIGSGIGVPYMGESNGFNSTGTGFAKIGGQWNELGIYIHDASRQPAGLHSGIYEGSFKWRLYAGTTTIAPPGNSAPEPDKCVGQLGKAAIEGWIKIQIEIKTSCTLELPATGKDIDFGSVTLQEIAAGVGPKIHELEVKCNNDKDMFITIGAGQHSGGNINNRQMQLVGGSALLKYSLKKPGGGEWGDAATLGSGHLVPGNFSNKTIVPIEATIPPQSGTFPLGDYKDTVQIQLWN